MFYVSVTKVRDKGGQHNLRISEGTRAPLTKGTSKIRNPPIILALSSNRSRDIAVETTLQQIRVYKCVLNCYARISVHIIRYRSTLDLDLPLKKKHTAHLNSCLSQCSRGLNSSIPGRNRLVAKGGGVERGQSGLPPARNGPPESPLQRKL